jgi:TPR repeat protein
MYNTGEGVPYRRSQAYAWWNIAATNGEEHAREGKEELAEKMTREQIDKAQELAREMVEANPKLLGD